MTRFSLAALLAVLVIATTAPVFAQVGEPPDDPLNYQRQPFDGQHRQQGGPTTYQAPQPEPAPTKEPVDQAAPAAKANPAPADPPIRQAAGPVHSYSDGRSQKQAAQWRNGRDQGPAYRTQVIDRTKTVYVTSEVLLDYFEHDVCPQVRINFVDGVAALDEQSRGLDLQLGYLNLHGWADMVEVKNGGQLVAYTFKPTDKARRDPEGFAKAYTAAQEHAILHSRKPVRDLREEFRNFLATEFEPLKAQVGTNTASLNSVIEWAKTQGYKPPATEEEVEQSEESSTTTEEAATTEVTEEATENTEEAATTGEEAETEQTEATTEETEQSEESSTTEEGATEAQPTNAQVLAAVQGLAVKLDESAKADEEWRQSQPERDQTTANLIGKAVAENLPQPVAQTSQTQQAAPQPSPSWGLKWTALPIWALLLVLGWLLVKFVRYRSEREPLELTGKKDPPDPPAAKTDPPVTKKTLPGEREKVYGGKGATKTTSTTLPPPPTSPAPKTEPEEPESLFGGGTT